jgi:predicted anti-sigma-YlaC factor YlaD
MNCKRVRELLLTDYFDGCLAREEVTCLEAHLDQCPGCRAVAAEAGDMRGMAWAGGPRMEAPPEIWRKVKAMIEAETPVVAPAGLAGPGVWERLKEVLFPRPGLVLASVLSVLLVAVIVMKTLPGAGLKNQDVSQVEYMASLMGGQDTSTADEDSGYGTDIEEVFLQS